MAFTLLSTKLHRPRRTTSLVARPRLTKRLDEGLRQGHRLSLVVAPAGYGKTTLVIDWLDRTGIPCAWLSPDEADNDPSRFFSYLAAALQKVLGPKSVQPLPEALPMTSQSPEAFVLPLINSLAAEGRPVILVLDDYMSSRPSPSGRLGSATWACRCCPSGGCRLTKQRSVFRAARRARSEFDTPEAPMYNEST